MRPPVDVPKLLAGSTAFGVEKSTSSAVARTICIASFADRTFVPAPRNRRSSWFGFTPASRASDSSSPTMPADCPVASEEQLPDSIVTNVWPPKFVQPLSAR